MGSPKIGSTTLTPSQANDMVAGLHYVNIHSTVEASGEIRGQILLAGGAVPAVSDWGMAVLIMCIVVLGTLIYRRTHSPIRAI
ncbi:MAG: CHRD domain-containing protein [Planctomycetota bacterium]